MDKFLKIESISFAKFIYFLEEIANRVEKDNSHNEKSDERHKLISGANLE